MGKDVIIACDFSSKADVMAFLDKSLPYGLYYYHTHFMYFPYSLGVNLRTW